MKSETGTNPLTTGGQSPLCPGTSDLNLLRYRERVIDLNAQISDGALDLCVAEQELDGPKIAGAPINQRRLRSSEGMGAEKLRFKSDPGNPLAGAVEQGPSFLFMEVPDIKAAEEALKGSDIVQPLHQTFYGSKEIVVREPGGHFVIFSQLPAR